MEVNTKFYLVMIIVIILIVGVLGALIVGSQYMFEKYKSEHPHIWNETKNEKKIYCKHKCADEARKMRKGKK